MESIAVSAKLELRSVREENVSLVAALNEYKVRAKNSDENLDEKELTGMALLRQMKRSEKEEERLQYGSKPP